MKIKNLINFYYFVMENFKFVNFYILNVVI